jgi:flagellar biosynthesis/type III secretory pathway protein FliH
METGCSGGQGSPRAVAPRGRNEGRDEGRKKGRNIGRKEGRKEHRKEGRKEHHHKIVVLTV